MDEDQPGGAAEGHAPDPGPFFELAAQPFAIVSHEGRWLRVNPAFEKSFGWWKEELRAQTVADLLQPDDRDPLRRVLLGDEAADIALNVLTADGRHQASRWRFTPAESRAAFLCVGTLVAERDEARERAQVRHLTNEIEHRVRNNLAVIRSIIRRSGESFSESEAFAHLQGRIDAYARVQSKLRFAVDDYRGVDLASLIEDELLAQSIREGDELTIEGPDVALTPKAAETIGLAMHELAMNCVKFGAFCLTGARVDIAWDIEQGDEGPRLRLTWSESGVAMDALPVRGDGFGMETLLRSLPYDLGGETSLDFAPGGIRFAMSAPLDRIIATSGGR